MTGEALDAVIEQYKNTSGIRDLEQAAEHIAANALYQIEVDHLSPGRIYRRDDKGTAGVKIAGQKVQCKSVPDVVSSQ